MLILSFSVTGTEAAKKKMKKRPGFMPTMSVSQMMVQRERPLNELKVCVTYS